MAINDDTLARLKAVERGVLAGCTIVRAYTAMGWTQQGWHDTMRRYPEWRERLRCARSEHAVALIERLQSKAMSDGSDSFNALKLALRAVDPKRYGDARTTEIHAPGSINVSVILQQAIAASSPEQFVEMVKAKQLPSSEMLSIDCEQTSNGLETDSDLDVIEPAHIPTTETE